MNEEEIVRRACQLVREQVAEVLRISEIREKAGNPILIQDALITARSAITAKLRRGLFE